MDATPESQGESASGTAIAELEERFGGEWMLAEVELAEKMTPRELVARCAGHGRPA